MSDIIYDLAEPIEAYRCWRVTMSAEEPKQIQLAALSFRAVWQREMTALPCQRSSDLYHGGLISRETIAVCDGPPCAGKRPHSPLGTIAHGCGIYAVKNIHQLVFDAGFHADLVIGKVFLGGRVWEHDDGYRAEKAQITGLYGMKSFTEYKRYFEFYPSPGRSSPHLAVIAETYGVPILDHLTDEEKNALVPTLQEHWIAARLGVPV